MKVYQNLDVELTYQNFGSTWLCILRGSSENIELVFNGLFNLQATDGDYKFHDQANTVAIFWSKPEAMKRFFFNLFYSGKEYNVPKSERKILQEQGEKFATEKLNELRETSHEILLDFKNKESIYYFTLGQMKAEKPDDDFKTSVLTHAFTDRNMDNRKMIGEEFGDVAGNYQKDALVTSN